MFEVVAAADVVAAAEVVPATELVAATLDDDDDAPTAESEEATEADVAWRFATLWWWTLWA